MISNDQTTQLLSAVTMAELPASSTLRFNQLFHSLENLRLVTRFLLEIFPWTVRPNFFQAKFMEHLQKTSGNLIYLYNIIYKGLQYHPNMGVSYCFQCASCKSSLHFWGGAL